MMNRLLALAIPLCVAVYMPGVALAAPSGQGYTPPSGQTATQAQTGTAMGQSVTRGQSMMTVHQSMGTGVAVGSSATGRTSSTPYSPGNMAPVVPRGASEMSRVATSSGTMVMYNANGVVYRVTYAPNGTYRYTMGGSSTGTVGTTRTAGGSTGSTLPVTGSTLPVTGVTRLPVTGGGSAPAQPALPLLLALTLIGAGVLVRRIAIAAQ